MIRLIIRIEGMSRYYSPIFSSTTCYNMSRVVPQFVNNICNIGNSVSDQSSHIFNKLVIPGLVEIAYFYLSKCPKGLPKCVIRLYRDDFGDPVTVVIVIKTIL